MKRVAAQLISIALFGLVLLVVTTITIAAFSDQTLKNALSPGLIAAGVLLITMGAFSLREGGVAEVPDWYFRWGGSYFDRNEHDSDAVLTTFGASLIVGVPLLISGVALSS